MSAVPLPEHGAAYQYLFHSYYGQVWRNDSANWNGSEPIETRLLYTADQLRAYGDAREAAAVERCIEAVRQAGPADGAMALITQAFAAAIRASAMPAPAPEAD